MKHRPARRAITFIELLVVIAIIVTILAMIFPAIRRMTLIFDRYCSTRGAVSFSMSSRCITSFLM